MARLRWHRAVALATALVGVATGFVARAPPAAGGARHRRGVARSADLPWSNDAGADSPAQAERVVGCMPFDVRELLLPGQSRYLHLYEARFISLFEEAHLKGDRGAIACGFMTSEGLLRFGVEARVEKWERLEVGVGVLVRAARPLRIERLASGEVDRFMRVAVREHGRAAPGGAGGGGAAADEAILLDEVRGAHDALRELGESANVELDEANELAVDPRAMMGHADLVAEAQARSRDEAARRPLAQRAAAAHAVLAGLCAADEFDVSETELLSFLALEGCPTQAKFDALMAETCADRLRVASAALTARHDELSEKAALRAEEWL